MKKVMLFVFNGDPMCFVHVLLNAQDMAAKGYQAGIVIEGAAAKLLPELRQKANPLHPLWEKVRGAGLIAGVCKACATKMGTLDSAAEQGLELLGDMAGHPSMAAYLDKGFEIISF